MKFCLVFFVLAGRANWSCHNTKRVRNLTKIWMTPTEMMLYLMMRFVSLEYSSASWGFNAHVLQRQKIGQGQLTYWNS